MKTSIRTFSVFVFCLWFQTGWSQLVVQNNYTSQQLVDSVLLGPGVMAFNVTYTGSPQSIGFFNGVNSNIGLDSGIILSSGKIITAIGPNNNTSAGYAMLTPGDSILTVMAGQTTRDASILEFDFIPSSDSIYFNYVFASEEYYEGVCTIYNDIFAFLISGPSITGIQNIALVPSTIDPVSISSINGGVLGAPLYNPSASYPWCRLNNTQYYVDNTTPPGATVQYDGFTVVLTAKVAVVRCATYHIKLAVADGGNDDTWDSSVFLEAGSFNSHYVSLTQFPQLVGASIDSSSVEGCGNAIIKFKRYDSISYPRTINYYLGGNAIQGVDYSISAPQISFLPGQDTTSLVVTPFYDANVEGIESIKLTILPDFTICSAWDTGFVNVFIIDQPPLSLQVLDNSPECPYDSVLLTAYGAGGGYGNYYNFNWTLGTQQYFGDSLWIPSYPSSTVFVQITDSCGQQQSSYYFENNYECSPEIPNIITPNNDGMNEYFVIPDLDKYPGLTLEIYDRWGNLWFSRKNYDNSWNAFGMNDGTYYYIIRLSDERSHTGFVTIFRH